MPTLDAGSNPPQGVAPQPVLRLLIGNPPREMLILAGVAFPDFDTGTGKLVHDDLVIRLGVTTTELFKATTSVTLAGILNTDSDFIFAADDSLAKRGDDGQLELHVNLGVMGDKSNLLKLSYHVQVLSDPLESVVSGTIRWAEALGAPTLGAQAGTPQLFKVSSGRFVQDPQTGNSLATTHWQSGPDARSGPPRHVDGMWAAPYVIRGVPLNERLQIVPQYLGGLVQTLNQQQTVFSPAREIQLSPSLPALTDVDFEMTFGFGPR